MDVPPTPMRTTAVLNLRAEPGGAILAALPQGAIVGVDGPHEEEGWVRVTITGVVAVRYLEKT